ncbi:Spy/CpxP family protein refolding chaperone [Aerosakkonemataceae cyanobacterium BLCC-F50]|uniref:Spy/CpxP family protein refolding chaperone n=1 Tax=Floridaenema flaviceps BLCC-F50 TaxID=3153642 RepID=A0ABV4Y0V1_9CYAN
MLFSRASAIAFLTLSISAVAIANPKPWFSQPTSQNPNLPNNHPNQDVPKWIQRLNLTTEQAQQMQTISNKYRGQIVESAKALRQAQFELGQMLGSDASIDSLRQKHRQVETLKQKVGTLRFESLLEMREVLNPEQRRQVAQNLQNRIKMQKKHDSRFPEMPPPPRVVGEKD